jgi:hypothetical protein
MAIRTSAITYSRGIPKNYNNFFFVSQANNNVIQPMSIYLKNFNFYNRNYSPPVNGFLTLPWNR